MAIQDAIDTLNNLDPQNIGAWPLWVKALAWCMIAVLSAGFLYYFQLSTSLRELERVERQEATYIKDYEKKAFAAANLLEYRQQMDDMQIAFEALLKQLPEKTEVPGLLEDISQTGLGSGLEFESIGLGDEASQDFYSELPINISVRGGYHSLAAFVSGVAALPRIVTLHDFDVQAASEKSNDLKMSVLARTYRYNKREE